MTDWVLYVTGMAVGALVTWSAFKVGVLKL